jgi:hypothetical protein
MMMMMMMMMMMPLMVIIITIIIISSDCKVGAYFLGLPFLEATVSAAAIRIFVWKISRKPLSGFQRNLTGTLFGQLRSGEGRWVTLT